MTVAETCLTRDYKQMPDKSFLDDYCFVDEHVFKFELRESPIDS